MGPVVRSAIALATLLTFGGCANPYYGTATSSVVAGSAPLSEGELGERTYRAVDRMLDENPALMGARAPVAVGSVADIQDVSHGTPFGNIIADFARTRLVQRGVPVTELRLRSSVLLERTQGEMMLARDRRAIYPPPAASDLLAGTYAIGSGRVYVSLKIISTADAHIAAAADFSVPLQGDAQALLLQTSTAMASYFDPAPYRR